MVIFLVLLLLTSDDHLSPTLTPAGIFLTASLSILFLTWVVLTCFLRHVTNHCYWKALARLKKQEQIKLNNSLWDKVTKNLGRKSKLFVFYHNDSLNIMRLNLKPCKDVFLRKLVKRNENVTPENHMEFTDRIFEKFLRNAIHLLNINVCPQESLGHHMATGSKCPCLLIREKLFWAVNKRNWTQYL